jgi:hypothetical protein
MGLGDIIQLLARHVWPVKWDQLFFHLVGCFPSNKISFSPQSIEPA